MIATNFSDLDTLFKDIQQLHQALASGKASELDYDLLLDKVKIYYSSLKNYTPSAEPIISFEKHTPEVITPTFIATPEREVKPIVEEIVPPVPPQPEKIVTVSELVQEEKLNPITPIFEPTPPPVVEKIIPEETVVPEPEVITPPVETITEKPSPQIRSSVKPEGYMRDNLYAKQETPKKKDLKSIIDINTRFGLIQQFFKGNIDFYNHELGWVNEANDIAEAQERFKSLCTKYGMSPDADLAATLLEIIKRCYA